MRWVSNLVVFILVLGIFAVLAGVAAYYWVHYFHGPDVRVPNVIGMEIDAAYETLINAGLRIETPIEFRYHDDLPEGLIIRQEPLPGANTKRNRQVRLTRSAGSPYVTVPDVRGRDLQGAALRFRERGLSLGRTAYVYHPDIPAQRCIAQNPSARVRAHQGSKVDLLISLGPEAEPMPMPNLVGRRLDDVQSGLRQAGLALGVVLENPDSNAPSNTIIETHPPPRAPVFPGEAIDVTVAAGDKDGAAPRELNQTGDYRLAYYEYIMPDMLGVGQVEVKVFDDDGLRTVRQGRLADSDRLRLEVPVRGPAQVFIYLDGRLAHQDVLHAGRGPTLGGLF